MYEAVDNIGIAVADLDAALEFYETLGFECERYSDADAQVTPADSDGTYFYVAETAGEEGAKRDGDLTTNPVGIDHVSLRVEDVDETYESLTDAGIDFFQEPTTEPEWGLRLAGTRDPSGNIFYVIERV